MKNLANGAQFNMPDLLSIALEPYKRPSLLRDGFLDQFNRICTVAQWLASNEPNEKSLIDTLRVFTSLANSKVRATLAAEFEINKIQLIRYAERSGIEKFYKEQAELDQNLSAHAALLERIYDRHNQSETSTFFLSDLSDDCFLEADEYSSQVEGTKRLLEGILDSVALRGSEDQPRRLGGAIASVSRFGRGLFSRSNFDALASIHHEIAENALSHGTYSRLNERSWPNINPAFGNSFHLQIRSLPLTIDNHQKIRELHPKFEAYVNRLLAKSKSANPTCWVFSFCDTGGGILAHFKEFGRGRVKEGQRISIKTLIDEKLSTREFSGSGYGLEKIFNFSKQLDAFSFIETTGASFAYDGISGEMFESDERVKRGTMVSIVISSSVQDAVPSN